jgi:hypothetical protein
MELHQLKEQKSEGEMMAVNSMQTHAFVAWRLRGTLKQNLREQSNADSHSLSNVVAWISQFEANDLPRSAENQVFELDFSSSNERYNLATVLPIGMKMMSDGLKKLFHRATNAADSHRETRNSVELMV